MSENVPVGNLAEKEIEALANSRAEREAFVKSTAVFILVWAVSFLAIPFVPSSSIRVFQSVVSVRFVYVIGSFLAAFVVGLITRWLVKESAYEKYYALYKEQLKQEHGM